MGNLCDSQPCCWDALKKNANNGIWCLSTGVGVCSINNRTQTFWRFGNSYGDWTAQSTNEHHQKSLLDSTICIHLHPRNLTWIPKMMSCKGYLLSKMAILGIHVSFRGCTIFQWDILGDGTSSVKKKARPSIAKKNNMCLFKGMICWSILIGPFISIGSLLKSFIFQFCF